MKFIVLLIVSCILCACQQKNAPEAPEPRPSTTTENVTVFTDSLVMPGLDRKRLLRIYVPPGYAASQRAYPVLYMHDGQNLFDDSTSYVGEWGVDEMLNTMAETGDLELLVVGIDNGQEKRMQEMSPWPNEQFGAAEGEAYAAFIVEVVKPLIDSTYRTLPDRSHTGIMGSSMGGFISHYAAYAYPQVFGKVGIFSPSYWYAENVFAFTRSHPVPAATRLYLLVGEKESATMAPDTRRMYEQILAAGHPAENIELFVDPEGTHSEGFWRDNFKPAVRWLFQEGTSE